MSTDRQAHTLLFRAREHLVQQRTGLVNPLRSYRKEFSLVPPIGIASLQRIDAINDDSDNTLPDRVRDICYGLLRQIAEKTARFDALMKRIRSRAEDTESA